MAERMVALEFGAVADASDAAGVAVVQKELHDRLLLHLRGRRRGGVSWRHYSASDGLECKKLVTIDGTRDGPKERKLLAYLTENPLGLLIVATCAWES